MMSKETKIYKRDDLQNTTYVIQKLIGKLLSHSDLWIIVNLHKKYELEYSDIEYVFKHCIEKGNRNMSYIEKVAIAYSEKGEKALEITNSRSLNDIRNDIKPLRKQKNDRKPAKATMPYLPFEEKLTDKEIEDSKKLQNIVFRIEIRNEVEKDSMIEVLKLNFEILDVGKIFEHLEGSKIIKFFNITVSKKNEHS